MVRKKLGLSSSSSPSLVFHNQLYMDGGLPDAWASFFSELYTLNPNRYDQENLSIINDAVNRLCLSRILILLAVQLSFQQTTSNCAP